MKIAIFIATIQSLVRKNVRFRLFMGVLVGFGGKILAWDCIFIVGQNTARGKTFFLP